MSTRASTGANAAAASCGVAGRSWLPPRANAEPLRSNVPTQAFTLSASLDPALSATCSCRGVVD